MARPVSTKHPRSSFGLLRAVSRQRKRPLSQHLTTLGRDYSAYLPDTALRKATRINGPFCQGVLTDRLLFTAMLRDFKVPEVFALLERGQLHARHAPGTLTGLLETYGGFVLKPAVSRSGKGSFNVALECGELLVNGQPSSLKALGHLLSQLSGYLVGERVAQDGYAQAIFPGSANSVRVVTMQDPDDDHRPFIGVAFHRFGSKTTGPIDNVSRGGLMANIDTQTGVMGSAITVSHETGEPYWCSHHPDTAVAIKGQAIPGWVPLQARLLELVAAYPFFRYVGWNVIFARGEAWLIGGQPNPPPVGQVFHPYLEDPKIRRFFEFYGVV